MCNGDLKAGRHSKKGITLVELIVAMTLTSIFAVLCVMLINPIERTYRGTLKLARAQLLADTLIDSIRKECDDVRHDETSDVWITGLSGNDDAQLFSDGPANKASSGNTLVFRRNNNYTEAIYAGVGISDANYTAVTGNVLTPEHTAHSIDALKIAGSENMKAGYVHFGYYQAKEDNRGIFPIESYDYTNPVMAKTYGDFNVELNFYDLTLRDSKYPAYVMCKLTIMEKGKEVYSRSAVLCFAANGSGKGSGSHHPVTPTVRDIEVNVVWNDNGASDKRPASGLVFTLKNSSDSVLGTHSLADVRTDDTQRFVFKNINTANGWKLSIAPDVISEYERMIQKTANGFLVTYTRVNEVMLIPGPDFNNYVKNKGITSFVFAKNDDTHLAYVGSTTPVNVSVDKKGKITDDYKLYIVSGTDGSKIAYVLSDTGTFNGNPSMSTMFKDCSDVTQFTGLDSIYTGNTTNMYQVFMNCRKLSMKLFKPAWDTSNVQTMDGMFRNIACDESLSENITVDISSFNFKNCHHYSGSGATQVNGINSLFRVDDTVAGLTNTSRIEKIVFPAGHKDMSNLSELDVVFRHCVNLKYLENFEDMDLSNVEFFKNVFYDCPSLENVSFTKWTLTNEKFTNVSGIFGGLTNLKTIRLDYLNIPHVTSLSGLFTIKDNTCLEHIYLNNLVVSGATSINSLFDSKTKLKTVEMRGGTFNTTESWTAEKVFYKCALLEEVDMTGFGNSKCTSFKSMFEGCKVLSNITGLPSWTTSGVTNFTNMFLNCNSDAVSGDFHLDISGFTFNQSESAEILMTGMFKNSGATLITFPSPAGAERVTNIYEMFANCKRLTGVENFILSTDAPTDAAAPLVSYPNVTSANNLFTYCYELKNVKLNLSIPKCVTITNLFSNCTGIVTLDLSKSDFNDCTKLQSLIVTCSSLRTLVLDEVNAPNCKTAENNDSTSGFQNIFNNCGNLNYLYMRKSNLNGITNFKFMPWGNLKELYLSEAKLSGVTVMEGLFKDKTVIEKFDISGTNFGAYSSADYLSASQMFMGCTKLKTVIAKGFKAPVNLSEMFSGCTSLATIDFEGWDTTKTTNMTSMFYNCSSMTVFDLSDWDTSNVTTMLSMFDGCSSAQGFDSSGWAKWSTSNVTTMEKMFHNFSYKSGVTAQYTINISNFDFSKVESFFEMFNCDEKNVNNRKDLVTTIVLPSGGNAVVDKAPSTVTYRMFRQRWNLTSIVNIEQFNFTVNNTDAQSTFAGTGLTIIDISSMDFSKITGSPQWMFNENRNLETIYVKPDYDYNDFISRLNLLKVEMFKGDKKLRGQNTTSNANDNNDKFGDRARIDIPGEKGYFSVK